MSDKKDDTDNIRLSQVVAGALAAVTAALVGSTMGVAGTVVGAGLASVISTVGGTLYLRSFQRTRAGVRTVRARVVGRSGDETVLVSTDGDPRPGEEVVADSSDSSDVSADRPPGGRRRVRWPVVAVTTLAAFALAMAAITGVEWLRGESLSGDSGTTFGSIVEPHRDSGRSDEPATPSSTTPSPTTTPSTSTNKTSKTEPTKTTTPPPSDLGPSSAPPVTTTTEQTPTNESIPPSN
ncbi:hypothetical protein [Actinophytocola oryzae]|uniref:Uncharacterized protein n=1 Tax=Actinophytocola oryzae TaxID=502181 RepID=A0A4V3FQS2_9PSEU|nr:hypothetical protein [Actinophytocola oryzae]TDV40781.1 hypothetical protein CLV71_122172 [Actinophytocola oryzae]